MGRGDRYLQPRFSVPVTDWSSAVGPWPFPAASVCEHLAPTKRFDTESRSWLCENCLADRNKEKA